MRLSQIIKKPSSHFFLEGYFVTGSYSQYFVTVASQDEILHPAFVSENPTNTSNPLEEPKGRQGEATPAASSNRVFDDLMKTKAHLGRIKWNRMMSPYLYGYRNNISIFNLEQTMTSLKQTLKILQNIKKKNGHVLFVNTSPKYSVLIKETASFINQSYINDRWIGGTLTNWKQLSGSILLFQKFTKQFDSFLYKNQISIASYIKAKKRYEGLKTNSIPYEDGIAHRLEEAGGQDKRAKPPLRKGKVAPPLPDIIILTNPERNNIIIEEAKKYQIPIIGFVDSNTSNHCIESIQYVIPGNNQSTEFIYFCLNLFAIILKGSIRSN